MTSTPLAEHVDETLRIAGLTRARRRIVRPYGEGPYHGFGYRTLQAPGWVEVWCYAARPTEEEIARASRLATRVFQVLTFAGFRSHYDTRNPQQVIVNAAPDIPENQHVESLDSTDRRG